MIIVWRVLNSCNLACPFCAYDKRLAAPKLTADPLQVRRFIDCVADWRRTHSEDVLLSWLGGEPLLWAELEALTLHARSADLNISTTTNGTTLASARSRRHLIEDYREVTISIDGFADFHDSMRGWRGAFGKLREGVSALARERDEAPSPMSIRANIVLMRNNIASFPDLCRELSCWGMDEISFNQLGGRDRPEFYPQHRLRLVDVDGLERLLPALRRELALTGTALIGNAAYLDRIRQTTNGARLPVSACDVARSFLFIDELGRISPCSFTPDHFGRTVDDLRTAADLDALIAALLAHQRSAPARDCADCPSTQQFSKWETAEA
jgi:MoaA/NifB/PqqE/SkfB family radical SAM enzyme